MADGSFVADRELVAALGTTARKYGSPVLCFHPRAEPVFFGALAVIRLKGAFWHCGLFSAHRQTAKAQLFVLDPLQYSKRKAPQPGSPKFRGILLGLGTRRRCYFAKPHLGLLHQENKGGFVLLGEPISLPKHTIARQGVEQPE